MKSKPRQFSPAGTVMSALRMLTSSSVFPRTLPPLFEVSANVPALGTEPTFPVVRIPKSPPSVGNSPNVLVLVPFGVPLVVLANDAPVTVTDGVASAFVIANAPAAPVWAVTVADAPGALTAATVPAVAITAQATANVKEFLRADPIPAPPRRRRPQCLAARTVSDSNRAASRRPSVTADVHIAATSRRALTRSRRRAPSQESGQLLDGS